MLQLVIPHLIASLQALSETERARYPALKMLYARGQHEEGLADSVEDFICRHYSISRQVDWPLAAITYEFDGGRAGSDYWLRADPVHVQVQQGKLIMIDELDISAEEATVLCEVVTKHFGNTFSPLPMQPGRWYTRVSTAQAIKTTPLTQARGKAIDQLLPEGSDALKWRKLLNEAQMLLFEHPVNQAREARGLPAVNSLWIWGGGTLPEAPSLPKPTAFYGTDFSARAVAKFCKATVHTLPKKWHAEIGDASILLFDQLGKSWLRQDLSTWEKTLEQLDSDWIAGMMRAGRTFSVEDPEAGVALNWQRFDRWKLWRRPKRLTSPDFRFTLPTGENQSGLDEFGNRY